MFCYLLTLNVIFYKISKNILDLIFISTIYITNFKFFKIL